MLAGFTMLTTVCGAANDQQSSICGLFHLLWESLHRLAGQLQLLSCTDAPDR